MARDVTVETENSRSEEETNRVVLPIEGMTCAACVHTVQGALEKVPA